MSHFNVLVFLPPGTGPDPEAIEGAVYKALDPYDENDHAERHMVGPVSGAEMRSFVNWCAGQVVVQDERRSLVDPATADQMTELVAAVTNAIGDIPGRFEDLYRLLGQSYNCGRWEMNAHGCWVDMDTCNPVGYWDWWAVGGRWDGWLAARESAPILLAPSGDTGAAEFPLAANAVYAADVDWNAMRGNRRQAAEKAMRAFEGGDYGWTNDKDHARLMLGLRDGETAADWIARRTVLSTHAVIDHGGVWHQSGRMGSFATVRDEVENWDEIFESVVAAAPAKSVAVIVDCHV